jgi:hypothetical protein
MNIQLQLPWALARQDISHNSRTGMSKSMIKNIVSRFRKMDRPSQFSQPTDFLVENPLVSTFYPIGSRILR